MALKLLGQLIAQNALHDVEIVMQQQRRRALLGLWRGCPATGCRGTVHVGGDFFLGAAFAGRADDEAARRTPA